jgi:hypothetical protein
MMKLSLHLNGTVIYSKEMKAIQVKVKLNALSNDGVFLQITTPGKVTFSFYYFDFVHIVSYLLICLLNHSNEQ